MQRAFRKSIKLVQIILYFLLLIFLLTLILVEEKKIRVYIGLGNFLVLTILFESMIFRYGFFNSGMYYWQCCFTDPLESSIVSLYLPNPNVGIIGSDEPYIYEDYRQFPEYADHKEVEEIKE